METSSTPNPYDIYPYAPLSFPATHIGRLAAIGRLFGLQTSQPNGARVLELGCGCGTNTLAMAQIFPSAKFVGIDSSLKQIEVAEEARVAAGLLNVRFLCRDIAETGQDLGEFDYILTHGVFSWVPDPVKEALLRISSMNLKPEGVAYISYNCLPGWRMRGALREMMLMHTARTQDLPGKVAQSLALLKFLADANSTDHSYGKFLHEQLDALKKADPSYIAHEFLEAENDAFYFSDFLKAASRHGLGYLGDSEPSMMIAENLPESAAQSLKAMNLNLVAQEQFMDFLRNRPFRGTLLCHQERTLNRTLDAARMGDFHVSPIASHKQPFTPTQPAILLRPDGGDWILKDPIVADLFTTVMAQRNGLPVPVLLDGVIERHSGRLAGRDSQSVRRELVQILVNGYFKKLVDFTLGPVSLAAHKISKGNPEALPLARWQAAKGERISNPRLDMFQPDPFIAALLPLCDGTRNPASLVEGMVEAHRSGRFQIHSKNELVSEPARVRQVIAGLCQEVIGKLLNLGIVLPKNCSGGL
jgi:methyltransferase-like protein/2-polyprenyl-3-methyl-5-hydroxy-6-metoxy-1,4-benzoquinol methylase